jgi:hypothetical protein
LAISGQGFIYAIAIPISNLFSKQSFMAKYLLIFCMLGSIATHLDGQADTAKTEMMIGHIETDRPGISEGAFLVPKGYFQMEHGFSIEDTDPGFIYSYPSSLWAYGVNENFEIRLKTQFITIQKEPNPDLNGWLPLAAGFKSKLTDQHGVLPKISFIGEMTFPGIVSADLETTYFAPRLILVFHHHVSDFLSIDYNGGAEWDGETGEPNFLYSFEPSINIFRRIGLFAEVYGSTPQRESGPIELRGDAGITLLVGQDLLLDFSAGQGITNDAKERFIEFGLSYRFKI